MLNSFFSCSSYLTENKFSNKIVSSATARTSHRTQSLSTSIVTVATQSDVTGNHSNHGDSLRLPQL